VGECTYADEEGLAQGTLVGIPLALQGGSGGGSRNGEGVFTGEWLVLMRKGWHRAGWAPNWHPLCVGYSSNHSPVTGRG
jgi:hypothetical protein